MLRVTFHLGGDQRTGKIDRRGVEEVVARYWEGATILYGTGIWRRRIEETAMIIVYVDSDSQVDSFAQLLREEFRQEEVLAMVDEC